MTKMALLKRFIESKFNFIESIYVSQLANKFSVRSGMLLIEIIIALGIIAIIGLAIAQCIFISSFWYHDSTHRLIAINKAATHLEKIIAYGFNESNFPKQEDSFAVVAKAQPYQLSLSHELLKNSYQFRLISVRVEWKSSSGKLRFIILRSII